MKPTSVTEFGAPPAMASHSSSQKSPLDDFGDLLQSQKADVVRELTDKLFSVVIVIGSLIGIVSAVLIFYKGITFDSASDILFVTCAVLVMVFRKKIPPDLLAIFLIALVGIDGLSKLLESGLNGLSGVSLAVCCVATGVFFGLRASMFVLAGVITAIVTTAGLSLFGTLHLHNNASWGSPISWIIRLLTITIYVSGLGLLISGIQRRLGGSLKALSERSSELENSIGQLNVEIASRRAAEEKLTKEEQKYRLLAENVRDVLVVQDLNNKILYVSPSVKTVFGYDVDEALSLPLITFFTPESRKAADAKFAHNLAMVVQGSQPPLFEMEYRRKDGSIFLGEVSSRFLYDSDGKPCGTQSLVRDITERKKAEAALRDSEERFRNLYETSTDAIFIVERDTKQILDVNPAAGKLYGYSRDEFLRMKNTDVSAEPEKTAGAMEQDVTIVPQRYHRKRNGTVFPIEAAIGNFMLKGRSVRTVFIRDISERKKADDERLKIESHLRQVQKLESLGVLAGGIAHDFNNLMSGIFGYIELAKSETAAGGKRNEYLAAAMESIGRARGLTRQLLTFAKGGAPERKVEPLGPLIQETAQFALSGSTISCVCTIPGDLWPVAFDRGQMAQVIDNIVINALQAMPAGGTIEITALNSPLDGAAYATLPEGRYVKVSIRDHGVGIARELLSCIFDPFFTTKEKGHGLGLATCYSIVKQHDGLIDVDSEPGIGSTFHIYLPASSKTVEVVPAMPSQQFKGCGCILVMDDDKTVRGAIAEMLKMLGFSVMEASNGSDALQLYQTEIRFGKSFAAVIADLTIPGGMGGLEMVDKFRKTDATTPVFVTSGYADASAMSHPEKYGFTASIRKPCTMPELATLLETHLKRDR
jgi:PAS domain S-box-containing protein